MRKSLRRTGLAGLLTAAVATTSGMLAPVAAYASDPILPDEVSAAKPARVVATALDAAGHPVITVREATDRVTAARLIHAARLAGNTVSVALDTAVHALEAPAGGDPYRAQQWDLATMKVPVAWQSSTGAGVTVAVIDTGVDASHPDLAGKVLTGYDAVHHRAGGDTDGNGHGTHVAGTIAALTGNGVGVSSVAPDVTILPVKVLDANGDGTGSDTAEGIIWAADHGAQVINMSLGGSEQDDTVAGAVAYARNKGVVVVAAAGNERTEGSPTSYPAAEPGVIAVAATDSADRVAYYSNAGGYVDVAAPGSSILSTYPKALNSAGYATLSGTSMASPHVAALSALLLAAAPALTADQVESALEQTAADLGATGKDVDYGYGRVDAAAALASVATTVTSDVTSRTVSYGAATSTTFRITKAGGTASRCVSVGAGAWSCATVTIGSAGTYTYARAAKGSFRVRLTVPGSTAAATSTYTVKAVMSVTRSAAKTLTVRVTGATGQKLTLQRYTAKRWTTVTTYPATTSRKITKLVAGGSYRVVLASTATIPGSTSKTVKA